MNTRFCLAVSAFALALSSAPAVAQHAGHPGMVMPPPAKKIVPAKKMTASKSAAKRPVAKKAAAKPSAPRRATAKPAASTAPVARRVTGILEAQPPLQPPGAELMPVDHSGHQAPSASPAPSAELPVVDHSQMDHSTAASPGMADHAGHSGMVGALGPYPNAREASATAWQPDTSDHLGIMMRSGDWMLMTHGVLNLVYDRQGGRRGDDKLFAAGMAMGMAQRPFGNGQLQFKAMLSPDPLMGARGYPLLLASGETADGETRLVDRQHPHDFFMELSTSISQNLGANSSVFLYVGLPGAPAFGPPAFMHREAIMDSPEAPISHHWLDSTHISFGVLTAGVILDRVKLEVSRFNGREPDEKRWDIETGPLDSTALRASWNPTAELSLQGSWAHFEDPEALEPGVDQKRWSASALYAKQIAPNMKLAGALAWGRKTAEGNKDDAFTAEASLKTGSWTAFARGEMAENRELLDEADHGAAYRVGKLSIGTIRDFRISENVKLGAGGLVAVNFLPSELAPVYGGHNPLAAMAFLRLKVD
ncbi:MAG: hypothetical protein ABIO43_07365 [Sphingomicrobium sp.]